MQMTGDLSDYIVSVNKWPKGYQKSIITTVGILEHTD